MNRSCCATALGMKLTPSVAIVGITIGYASLLARMKNYERRLVKTLAANPHPAAYSSIQETAGGAPVKEEV